MLIYHLLLALAVNHDRKVIECPNLSPNLKAIREIYGNRNTVLTQLIQECVLDID